MSQIRAQARSRKDIRHIAEKFREGLGLSDAIYLPVTEVFEVLPYLYDGLTTEIVEDHELKDRYAETDIDNKIIRIRQSIYDKACAGDGFSRMTIMHEIGHYECLVNQPISFSRAPDNVTIAAYEDPEWHAKCFAGEVMVPVNLTKDMSHLEIKEKCGVSDIAARYQYNINKKDRA